MIKFNKALALVKLGLFLVLFRPLPVLAASVQEVLAETPPPLVFLLVVIRNVLFILTGVVSLGFLAMLVVGGFRLIFAGGDPKALGEAKNVLTFAALGIFLAFSAFLIISLVSAFTGIPGISKFSLIINPSPYDQCVAAYVEQKKVNPSITDPILFDICQRLFRQATQP